jgi:tetratricopeptide (TPR) repeat protein
MACGVLAVGVGVAVWQWRVAADNYRVAEAQRQGALANFRLARDAVDRYLAKVARHPGLRAPGGRPLQRDLLDAAREFYARFVDERDDDPTLAADVARAHLQLGRIAHETGARDVAVNHFRRAQTLLEPLLAARPDDLLLATDLVRVAGGLGLSLHALRQDADALTAFERGRELGDRLAADHPDALPLREALYRLYYNLGFTHEAGRREAALTAYERARDLSAALVRDQPDNRDYRTALALSCTSLGAVRRRMALDADRQSADEAVPLYAAAIQSLEQARGLWEDLAKGQARVPEEYQSRLAGVALNLGAALRSSDQPDAAVRAFDMARMHYEKLVALYPEVTGYQLALVGTYDNLSLLASRAGQLEESLAWCRKSIPILEAARTRDPTSANLLRVLRNTSRSEAESLTRLGRHAEALPAWDRAIRSATGDTRDELRLLKAQTLARSGDHARAVAEVADVPTGTVPGLFDFLTAGVYALASTAAHDDTSLDTTVRDRRAARHASQALEALGRAKERGYFNQSDRIDELKTNTALDSLRDRADFQQFLASVIND